LDEYSLVLCKFFNDEEKGIEEFFSALEGINIYIIDKSHNALDEFIVDNPRLYELCLL